MKAYLIVILVALAVAVAGERFHFGCTLTGAQCVPPVQTPAEGSGAFHFDDDDKVLTYSLAWEGLKGLTSAHVHGPARPGNTAGHVIEFDVDDDTELLSGAVELDDDLIEWLHRGLLYVNIHTEENEAGELRCQIITTAHEFYAHLSGERQRPTKVNTNAKGKGSFEYDPDLRELRWDIEHEVDRPTMAHIHGPATEQETADAIIVFDSPHSKIQGSQALTEQQVEWLKTGLLYVNIHSEQHPNGEIRGQVVVEATSSGEQGVEFVVMVGLVLGGLAIATLAVLGGVVAFQHYQRQKYTAILPDE